MIRKVCTHCKQVTHYPIGMQTRIRCAICRRALSMLPRGIPQASLVDGALYVAWDNFDGGLTVVQYTEPQGKAKATWGILSYPDECESDTFTPISLVIAPDDYDGLDAKQAVAAYQRWVQSAGR